MVIPKKVGEIGLLNATRWAERCGPRIIQPKPESTNRISTISNTLIIFTVSTPREQSTGFDVLYCGVIRFNVSKF